MRLAGGSPQGDLQPGRFPTDFADYAPPHTLGPHINPLETQGLPASRITHNQGGSPQAEFLDLPERLLLDAGELHYGTVPRLFGLPLGRQRRGDALTPQLSVVHSNVASLDFGHERSPLLYREIPRPLSTLLRHLLDQPHVRKHMLEHGSYRCCH